MDILPDIINKVYSLVEDFKKTGTEVFVCTTFNTFTITEQNLSEITGVSVNGIGSGISYTYNAENNKITINETLVSGDIIEIDYSYHQYTNDEMIGYVRASMVWISVYAHNPKAFDIDSDSETIEPTPTTQEADLIALIASIILKPDYTSYRLPNLTVTYRRELPKYERIEKLIAKWEQCGEGVTDTIQFNIYIY